MDYCNVPSETREAEKSAASCKFILEKELIASFINTASEPSIYTYSTKTGVSKTKSKEDTLTETTGSHRRTSIGIGVQAEAKVPTIAKTILRANFNQAFGSSKGREKAVKDAVGSAWEDEKMHTTQITVSPGTVACFYQYVGVCDAFLVKSAQYEQTEKKIENENATNTYCET